MMIRMKCYRLSGFSLFEALLAWFIFIISIILLARIQILSLQRMRQAIKQTQVVFDVENHGIESHKKI